MKFQFAIKKELEKFDKIFPNAFSTKVALLDLILRYAVKKKGKRIIGSLRICFAGQPLARTKLVQFAKFVTEGS